MESPDTFKVESKEVSQPSSSEKAALEYSDLAMNTCMRVEPTDEREAGGICLDFVDSHRPAKLSKPAYNHSVVVDTVDPVPVDVCHKRSHSGQAPQWTIGDANDEGRIDPRELNDQT